MKLKQLLTAIKYRAEQVLDVDITDLVYDYYNQCHKFHLLLSA